MELHGILVLMIGSLVLSVEYNGFEMRESLFDEFVSLDGFSV